MPLLRDSRLDLPNTILRTRVAIPNIGIGEIVLVEIFQLAIVSSSNLSILSRDS